MNLLKSPIPFFLILILSCSDDPSDDWSKENTVVYHWRAEPDDMHPTNGSTSPRRVLMGLTQRFLVNTDYEKLDVRPDLVKKLPDVSADGLQFTYELRDEVTWDDGTQLTVDDVEFTLKANKCPVTDNPQYKSYFEFLRNLNRDPGNQKKFTLMMSSVYIQNVALFVDMPILQRKFYDPSNILARYSLIQFSDTAFARLPHPDLDAWGKEFNSAKYGHDLNFLQGLGAYKITKWEPRQQIELTRKKNHWTQKLKNPGIYDVAYPEKIICRLVMDETAIELDLKKQNYDASSWIPTRLLAELQKDSNFNRNYHSAFVPNFNFNYLAMNLKPKSVNRPPFFTDKKVRRAMAYLIPIDKASQDYYHGKCIRMASLCPPSKTKTYNKDLRLIPFSVDTAKSLLDAAGWVDTDGDNLRDKMIDGKKMPFNFDLMIFSGNLPMENFAKDIQDAMKQAGVKCNVVPVDFGRFYEIARAHNFDMFIGAFTTAFAYEDYKQVWHSDSWEHGGSNFFGFGTPESDALIDSIRINLNDTLRIRQEKRLQAIIYEEQPAIFLFQVPARVAIHKRFGNADMYYEQPAILLNNLKLLSPGGMNKPADTQ